MYLKIEIYVLVCGVLRIKISIFYRDIFIYIQLLYLKVQTNVSGFEWCQIKDKTLLQSMLCIFVEMEFLIASVWSSRLPLKHGFSRYLTPLTAKKKSKSEGSRVPDYYYVYWTKTIPNEVVRLRGLLKGTLINVYLRDYNKSSPGFFIQDNTTSVHIIFIDNQPKMILECMICHLFYISIQNLGSTSLIILLS